jgi:hypothetical protein
LFAAIVEAAAMRPRTASARQGLLDQHATLEANRKEEHTSAEVVARAVRSPEDTIAKARARFDQATLRSLLQVFLEIEARRAAGSIGERDAVFLRRRADALRLRDRA